MEIKKEKAILAGLAADVMVANFGQACEVTESCGATACSRRSKLPARIVARVASTPTRSFSVADTASRTAGSTTPYIGTGLSCSSTSSALEVAVPQATSTAFTSMRHGSF